MTHPDGTTAPPGAAPQALDPTGGPATDDRRPGAPARLLAFIAVGLTTVVYLLGFIEDFESAGRLAGPLVIVGGLLAGAAALPRAGRVLLPAAVSSTTGALLFLQVVVLAPRVSSLIIIALVLAFLVATATVAAVLLDAGVLTMPAPRPRTWVSRPAPGPTGYGQPPGYGYGQPPDQGGYGQLGYPPPGSYQGGGYGAPHSGGFHPPPGPPGGAYAQPGPYGGGYPPYGQQPAVPRPEPGPHEWFARPDAAGSVTPPTGVPVSSSPPEWPVAPADTTIVGRTVDTPPSPPTETPEPDGTGDHSPGADRDRNQETRYIDPADRPPS